MIKNRLRVSHNRVRIMTFQLVDYLVTICNEFFVLNLINESTFFKGIVNIFKKSSYNQLKQKIIDLFLSIAGRLKRNSLNEKVNPDSMK